MDLVAIEKDLAKFLYDLETEDRLVRVGLKETSESQKVYQKFKHLITRENLAGLATALKAAKDAKVCEALERYYFTIVGCLIGLELAKDQDKITTYFSNSKVSYEGEKVAYFELAPRIAKEPQFARREKLDELALTVVSKANTKQLALLKAEIKHLRTIGFNGYLDYAHQAKKVDYAKFYKIVGKIKKDTDKIWFRVASEVSQETFGKPFKNVRSCHLVYLRSMTKYDNYYPKDKVVTTFKKFVSDIGLGELLKTINIDDVARPRKNPRAVCYWPDPPKEVHLVIKPIGGEQDYEAMLHEGGHSLHAASIDPKLPYHFKMLARSNALTETYAFILEDLVFEPAWLSRYLNISVHTGNKILEQATFVNLMLLRRYLGKFSYEYQLFSGKSLAKGPALYARNLKDSTGFSYNKNMYLADMDGYFYSADYLRAWIAAAQIKHYLRKKFGASWFFNQKAGKFLRDLYTSGVTYEVEDVVKKLGYKPFDTKFLTSGYTQILK